LTELYQNTLISNEKFLKFVQSVCEDADVRMSHLEALWIGEAKCAIQIIDLGNSTALVNKVRRELQGPMV